MKRNKRLAALTSGLAGGLALAATPAWGSWGAVNLPYGVTEISHVNYILNLVVLWICVIVGIGVYGVMAYSIYHHRKDKGHEAAVHFHHNTLLEVAWTIIPTLILIFMAYISAQGMILLYNWDHPDMRIKVTGFQWGWRYQYMGEGVAFYSRAAAIIDKSRAGLVPPSQIDHYPLRVTKKLVVPTNTKIQFLITAVDVIHAWWVPAFGWKMDAIPGFINPGWATVLQPGVYRGQCTELCGRDHGYMPIVVKAVPPEEFKQWLAKQKQREPSINNALETLSKPLLKADQPI